MNIAEIVRDNYVKERIPRKVLFIQLYSMRSYKDDLYNPVSDGNANHTLHEIYNLINIYKVPVEEITITIPRHISENTFKTFSQLVKTAIGNNSTKLEFLVCDYAENVANTRINAAKIFKKITVKNLELYHTDIVCDYELVDLHNQPLNVIYRFNTTPTDNELLTKAEIECAIKYPTSVFNDWQIKLIDNVCEKNNAFICRKWFNPILVQKIALIEHPVFKLSKKTLFVPFRLTDQSYHIEELLNEWIAKNPKLIIVVTDPNDTFDRLKQKIDNISNCAVKINMTKTELYRFCLDNKNQLVIDYRCNPIFTLHQTFLEFLALCPNALECDEKWKKYSKETYFIDESVNVASHKFSLSRLIAKILKKE